MRKFDYTLDYKNLDLRKQPELYAIGKGEQGVLLVEPYKSEILPYWKFKNPEVAKVSAEKIYQVFLDYLKQNDLVGADMARKFLQMGFTRSRRYANHKSGRKYSAVDKQDVKLTKAEQEKIVKDAVYKDPRNKRHKLKTKIKQILPLDTDPIKAESAKIFYEKYQLAKQNPQYQELIAKHNERYANI